MHLPKHINWIVVSAAAAVAAIGLVALPAARQAVSSNESASIPRAADGKPDFSGIWQGMTPANYDIQARSADHDGPAGFGVVEGNELPYRPDALAKKAENYKNRTTDDTEPKCFLPGVPRIMYMPHPFQIVQTPKTMMMLFEYLHATRNVFMDTPHIKGPIEWWMGDSRGTWKGDTLVVDVVHFNAETRFDRAGNHHSEEMHVVEEYTLADRDHLRYTATIEDPKVFTRPWKMNLTFYRRTELNFQLLDYECYAFALDDEPIVAPGATVR